MTWIDLPHPWILAWENIEAILEQFNRRQAHALCVTVDDVEVYPRLLIPDWAALEDEARLYPQLRTSQAQILRDVLVRLATRYNNAHTVTVGLFWGGLEGVRVRPLVTFGKQQEVAA